ncbi:MAG: radical SAM protein [bacterium]|nr:radical SAM protein [bacterium]
MHLNSSLPKFVFVELTNICNFDCTFCATRIMKRQKGMMDFNLYRKIVNEAKDIGINNLNLWLMGEPFLYPKIFECIEYAKDKNIGVSLITNGSLFNAHFFQKFFSLDLSNINNMIISYHTPNKETFNLRNSKEIDFNIYCEQISRFIKEKIKHKTSFPLEIRFLINILEFEFAKGIPNSYEKIKDSLHFIGEINSKFKFPTKKEFEYYNKCNDYFRIEIIPDLYLRFEQTHDWNKIFIPQEAKVVPAKRGYCKFPFDTLGVLWNGDCTICCVDFDGEINIGNASDCSLREILESNGIKEIRNNMKKHILSENKCQYCKGMLMNSSRKSAGYYKKLLGAKYKRSELKNELYRLKEYLCNKYRKK